MRATLPDPTPAPDCCAVPLSGPPHLRLHTDEAAYVQHLLDGLHALFAAHHVQTHALITLRVEELLVHALLARRAEAEAFDAPPEDAAPRRTDPLERAGKARERLRRAMKELEEACAKQGTPIDQPLPDRARPLLERTAGIAEGALRPTPPEAAATDDRQE